MCALEVALLVGDTCIGAAIDDDCGDDALLLELINQLAPISGRSNPNAAIHDSDCLYSQTWPSV